MAITLNRLSSSSGEVVSNIQTWAGQTDLTFHCSDGRVDSHQVLFCLYSPFLRTLFSKFQIIEWAGDMKKDIFVRDRRKGGDVVEILLPDFERHHLEKVESLIKGQSLNLSSYDELVELKSIIKDLDLNNILNSLSCISAEKSKAPRTIIKTEIQESKEAYVVPVDPASTIRETSPTHTAEDNGDSSTTMETPNNVEAGAIIETQASDTEVQQKIDETVQELTASTGKQKRKLIKKKVVRKTATQTKGQYMYLEKNLMTGDDGGDWEAIPCIMCTKPINVVHGQSNKNRRDYQKHLLDHYTDRLFTDIKEPVQKKSKLKCIYNDCGKSYTNRRNYIEHLAFKHEEWYKRINMKLEENPETTDEQEEKAEYEQVKIFFMKDKRILPLKTGQEKPPLWIEGTVVGNVDSDTSNKKETEVIQDSSMPEACVSQEMSSSESPQHKHDEHFSPLQNYGVDALDGLARQQETTEKDPGIELVQQERSLMDENTVSASDSKFDKIPTTVVSQEDSSSMEMGAVQNYNPITEVNQEATNIAPQQEKSSSTEIGDVQNSSPITKVNTEITSTAPQEGSSSMEVGDVQNSNPISEINRKTTNIAPQEESSSMEIGDVQNSNHIPEVNEELTNTAPLENSSVETDNHFTIKCQVCKEKIQLGPNNPALNKLIYMKHLLGSHIVNEPLFDDLRISVSAAFKLTDSVFDGDTREDTDRLKVHLLNLHPDILKLMNLYVQILEDQVDRDPNSYPKRAKLQLYEDIRDTLHSDSRLNMEAAASSVYTSPTVDGSDVTTTTPGGRMRVARPSSSSTTLLDIAESSVTGISYTTTRADHLSDISDSPDHYQAVWLSLSTADEYESDAASLQSKSTVIHSDDHHKTDIASGSKSSTNMTAVAAVPSGITPMEVSPRPGESTSEAVTKTGGKAPKASEVFYTAWSCPIEGCGQRFIKTAGVIIFTHIIEFHMVNEFRNLQSEEKIWVCNEHGQKFNHLTRYIIHNLYEHEEDYRSEKTYLTSILTASKESSRQGIKQELIPNPITIGENDQSATTWQCKKCPVSLPVEDQMRHHVVLEHLQAHFNKLVPVGEKIYTCTQCHNHSTTDRQSHILHLAMSHQVVEVEIYECIKESRALLLDIDVIRCRCERHFRSSTDLRYHIVSVHYKGKFKNIPKNQSSYPCRVCNMHLNRRSHYIQHCVDKHNYITQAQIDRWVPGSEADSHPDSASGGGKSDFSQSDEEVDEESTINFSDSVSQANLQVQRDGLGRPEVLQLSLHRANVCCPVCLKRNIPSSSFEDHLKCYHDIKESPLYHCLICDTTMSFAQQYYHIHEVHSQEYRIKCLSCDDLIDETSCEMAIILMRIHSLTKRHKTNANKFMAEKNLFSSFRYSCQLCSTYFKTSDAIAQHGKSSNHLKTDGHRIDPVYMCHLCDFSKAASKFSDHCRGHQHCHNVENEANQFPGKYGRRPNDLLYVCLSCDTAFNFQSLVNHIKDGTCRKAGFLKIKCGPCDVVFRNGGMADLNKHIHGDQHTNCVLKFSALPVRSNPFIMQYKYKCESCLAGFSNTSRIKSHLNCQKVRFRCLLCKKSTLAADFERHSPTCTELPTELVDVEDDNPSPNSLSPSAVVVDEPAQHVTPVSRSRTSNNRSLQRQHPNTSRSRDQPTRPVSPTGSSVILVSPVSSPSCSGTMVRSHRGGNEDEQTEHQPEESGVMEVSSVPLSSQSSTSRLYSNRRKRIQHSPVETGRSKRKRDENGPMGVECVPVDNNTTDDKSVVVISESPIRNQVNSRPSKDIDPFRKPSSVLSQTSRSPKGRLTVGVKAPGGYVGSSRSNSNTGRISTRSRIQGARRNFDYHDSNGHMTSFATYNSVKEFVKTHSEMDNCSVYCVACQVLMKSPELLGKLSGHVIKESHHIQVGQRRS